MTQEKYPRLRIPADDGSDQPIGWLGALAAILIFGCFIYAAVTTIL